MDNQAQHRIERCSSEVFGEQVMTVVSVDYLTKAVAVETHGHQGLSGTAIGDTGQ